jgi:hypothetical protein
VTKLPGEGSDYSQWNSRTCNFPRWIASNLQLNLYFHEVMSLVGKLAVFALAVLFAALPVMACVVPDAAMTPAERECCKKMAERCGDMGMAKSHPCCQVTATPADFHALKTASSELDHVSLVLFHALLLTAQTDAYVSLAQWSSRVSCTHSPPGLESLTTTVLRI